MKGKKDQGVVRERLRDKKRSMAKGRSGIGVKRGRDFDEDEGRKGEEVSTYGKKKKKKECQESRLVYRG